MRPEKPAYELTGIEQGLYRPALAPYVTGRRRDTGQHLLD